MYIVRYFPFYYYIQIQQIIILKINYGYMLELGTSSCGGKMLATLLYDGRRHNNISRNQFDFRLVFEYFKLHSDF